MTKYEDSFNSRTDLVLFRPSAPPLKRMSDLSPGTFHYHCMYCKDYQPWCVRAKSYICKYVCTVRRKEVSPQEIDWIDSGTSSSLSKISWRVAWQGMLA